MAHEALPDPRCDSRLPRRAPVPRQKAKIYDGSCAFEGTTRISEMKRTAAELVDCLFRHSSFPNGVVLLTGTGIVPDADFTLEPDDEIEISIDLVGTLRNRVAKRKH